jgi:hypothetical protein
MDSKSVTAAADSKAPPRPASDDSNVTGLAIITLTGADGRVKARQHVRNLITDAGDQYHAKRIAAGVAPLAPADVTKVTGMKLGSGATAVAKSGAGAALVTYVTGSNKIFDTGFPTTENLGAGLGWTTTYQVTFEAGVGTAASLTEVALVTDAATNATSTAANTIARVTFAATPKGATDVLTIAWAHKQLGS